MVKKASKYIEIRDLLFSKILKGEFPNQTFLPPERDLCEFFQMSRITVRAALKYLEQDGIIQRVQGQGTRVTYKKGASQSQIESIAIVSNYLGPFHSDLMSGVNQVAELQNALVIYKERISEENIFSNGGTIHQLIKNKIKNIIIWTQRKPVPVQDLEIARGLGTNLVFFDTIQNSSCADDIALDNYNAIGQLGKLFSKNDKIDLRKIVFLGCYKSLMSSSIEREDAYDKYFGGKKILLNVNKSNWKKELNLALKSLNHENCQGLLSANGYFALEAKKQILRYFPNLMQTKLVTIDNEEPHFMDAFQIDRIAQPYLEFGRKSFELLRRQNDLGNDWKAQKYLLKGELIIAQA